MSRVRMHFCTLVARGNGAGTTPVKYGMNGTMPATVYSSAGSSLTSDADGTTVWPRSPKKVSQRRWISAVCTGSPYRCPIGTWRAGRRPDGGGGSGRGALGEVVDRVLRVRDSGLQLRLTGSIALHDSVTELAGLAVDIVEELLAGIRLGHLVGDHEADGDSGDQKQCTLHRVPHFSCVRRRRR